MMPRSRIAPVGLISLAILLGACADPASSPAAPEPGAVDFAKVADTEIGVVSAGLQALNQRLAASGAAYGVVFAEALLSPKASPLSPRLALANDRTQRIGISWVQNDPRRAPDPAITWTAWSPLSVANGAISTTIPVDRAMATWNANTCSGLRLGKRPSTVAPPSIIFGGITTTFPADIGIVGFIPGYLMDFLFGPGSSVNVIGVTVPYVWGGFDSAGNFIPSDIDRDGELDYAFAEILFNDDFAYSLAGGGIDVESVVLHEAGHALGLGHFGKLTFDPRSVRLQASPRAVMNAGYVGALRTPLGTDNASMCSLYANW